MLGGMKAAISFARGFAAVTLTVISFIGCAAAHHQDAHPPASARPAVVQEPRVITNLSQLSSAPSAIPMHTQHLLGGTAAFQDSTPGPNEAQNRADTDFNHLYLSQLHTAAHGGEARAAGSRTLLNAKARKFPEFSYALLNQALVAAQELEAKKLDGRKLPDDIKPMILVAALTPQGKLTDIAVEQHTGVGVIDRIIIDACKKGLWTMNPPPGAADHEGQFRMRFEAQVMNYSNNREGAYSYITNVGLALL
jgi:hypothetical protein